MKSALRKFLVALFRIPEGISLSFWWMNFYSKKILRINADVSWPVHMTSTLVHPDRIRFGKGPCPGDSPGNYIQAYNGIELGDYVNLAPNVGLVSAGHDPLDNDKHLPSPPIKIGDHCWIGMNSVVLPGVELGDYVIVGAGSVVTKSFPGYCIIAGNPAKVIRELPRPGSGGNAEPSV